MAGQKRGVKGKGGNQRGDWGKGVRRKMGVNGETRERRSQKPEGIVWVRRERGQRGWHGGQ